MKKKIKVANSGTNIFVIDTKAKQFKGTREKAGFFTTIEAEEYIENHERPNDLICIFDKHFEESYLERFEQERKKYELNDEDIKIFDLIKLGNYKIAIEKYLKKDISNSLCKLKKHNLISPYF